MSRPAKRSSASVLAIVGVVLLAVAVFLSDRFGSTGLAFSRPVSLRTGATIYL